MRFAKWLLNLASNKERDFKERVFIVLTMAAVGIASLALAGDILYKENIVEVITLIITIVATPLFTYYGVKNNKINFCSHIISLSVIFVIMPIIFFFGGGVEGGAIPWLIFSYLYIGLVMTGAWRLASLIMLTITIVTMYTTAYFYPELVVKHSRDMFFVDSVLAVIEVGFVCFIMAWFQGRMFWIENKRAEEEAKKYEELNRSQNRFFSSMSHEIRTPINSILGLNEIILRQSDASDEIIKDAGNIQGAGKMLLSLVNDILDISKIEAGKMDIVPVNYNIAAMISEIVNMMWLRAEQKGLKLKVEIDPTLPTELYGDEVRIKQVLINLLNNSVKYTKEGSVSLHIEVEESQNDRVRLSFTVSDTGMGIKQDALPYLFNAFQRVDEEKNRNIEGTGLGLSIVKQLVDLMGGDIRVNSVYTQGSTFVVSLWQSVTNAEAVGDINITNYGFMKRENDYEAGFKAPYASLLIVDDNEMNLEVEKKLLTDTEMQIDTVSSGIEALSKTLTTRYDVILMDHLMPEMDGIECLQRIRRQTGGLNNHAPVIALTANAGSEIIELYNRSGFDGYLVKPVTGHQLEEMVLKHMPESKVVRTEGSDFEKAQLNTARGYSKKIPIQIATSTLCDLPTTVIKTYQIDTIPFHVCSDDMEFYDGIEVSSDELLRYTKEGMEFYTTPPTVEEFEKFFGQELKKAHQLLYIAVSSDISKEYEAAKEAARSYGNVYVFNSTTNSAAMGLLALCAYKMLTANMTPGKMIEEMIRIKDRISCSYIMDDMEYLYSIKMFGKSTYRFMDTLGIRPIVRVKNGTYGIDNFCIGNIRSRYNRFIDSALTRRANPDQDVVIVPYADISNEDLKWIESRIREKYNFKHIVFQKSSSVIALRCGAGAFGLIFLRGGTGTYALGDLFDCLNEVEDKEYLRDSYADEKEDLAISYYENSYQPSRIAPESDTHIKEKGQGAEVKWYENIAGVDPNTALENCGSEESLRTVLKIFYDSIDDKADELNGFYEAEDYENYTIKVHALKSSARIIGALKLSDDARALESAGDEKDAEYIKSHHDDLIKEFMAYKDILAKLFADDVGTEETEADDGEQDKGSEQPESDFDEHLMESVYETLLDAAKAKDNDIIKGTLDEMEEYGIPESHKELFDRLGSCYENSDYDGMISLIEERG